MPVDLRKQVNSRNFFKFGIKNLYASIHGTSARDVAKFAMEETPDLSAAELSSGVYEVLGPGAGAGVYEVLGLDREDVTSSGALKNSLNRLSLKSPLVFLGAAIDLIYCYVVFNFSDA